MWASGAARLAATHRLLTEMDLGMVLPDQHPRPVQLGSGQDQQTSKIVLVEIFDRVEQIAVEGH